MKSGRVARILEIEELRERGDAARLAQLIEHGVLEDDLLRSAIGALGRLGSPAAVPLLVRLLDAEDDDLRMSAAVALRSIASRESVDALIRALQDPRDSVAWTAADALGRIRDKSAIDPLAASLASHRHGWVRLSAASALAAIAGDDCVRDLDAAAAAERNPLRRRRLRKLSRKTRGAT